MPLSAERLRTRLDERVASRLAPLAWGLAAVFAIFTAVTAIYQPAGATRPLLLIDGAGTLAMVALALLFQRVRVEPAYAQPALAAVLSVALGASLAAIKLLHLAVQTTNVMLVMVAAASLFLNLRLTTGFLVVAFAAWMGIFITEPVDDRWLNALFALLATTIVAGLIQVVRVREATRIEELLASVNEKAEQLELARAQEETHARQLEAANESLEAFSYVVAHDLKEPIRATRLYLDEAMETKVLAEKEVHLRMAAKSAENLQRLVGGLLDWSRVTTAPLETASLDVALILADEAARSQFEQLLKEREAQLVVAPDIPRVLATPALLRQILGNLILNAVRHNPKERPLVRVLAGRGAPAGMIDIVVADDGPGFPPNVVQRVAGLKNRPSTVRSGFGLAIAHRAAARLEGSLRLENTPAGGEAHLLLPAAPADREGALARRVRDLV